MCVAGIALAGCGSASRPQGEVTTAAAPQRDAPGSPGAEPTESATGRDPRTRWIGDIPYDVFYDRPLEVYREGSALGTHPAVEAEGSADPAADTSQPEVTAASESGHRSSQTAVPGIDWGSVVPIEVLDAEAKQLRNRLSASLQTVATFNANTKGIETDGSVLALLAAIVERHPQQLRWSEQARFVRQLAYDIYLNATGKGRGPFQSTKEPFEKIVTIWDGGPPPEIEAARDAPLGEVGDRARVMQRIDSSYHWLRSDINTETRIKEERENVIRESTVLAALALALSDPSFDDADREDYQALLRRFIDGQLGMATAARTGQFAEFEAARDQVQKSCDACHQEFRTGGGSGL